MFRAFIKCAVIPSVYSQGTGLNIHTILCKCTMCACVRVPMDIGHLWSLRGEMCCWPLKVGNIRSMYCLAVGTIHTHHTTHTDLSPMFWQNLRKRISVFLRVNFLTIG